MRMVLIDNVPYLDLDAAATACNATTQTIRNWLKMKNPPPVTKDMLFPLEELGEWIRREQIYKKGRGGGFIYMPDFSRFGATALPPTLEGEMQATVIVTKTDAETAVKVAQAEKLNIEIAQMKGELVSARAVELALSESNSVVKTRLLSLPVALAPLVANTSDVQDARKIIEDAVIDVLTELSSSWQYRDQDGDDDESVE